MSMAIDPATYDSGSDAAWGHYPTGIDLVSGNRNNAGPPATPQVTQQVTAGWGPTISTISDGVARLTLAATAVGATAPALVVTIQTSRDGGATDPWRTVGAFGPQSVVGAQRMCFAGLDRTVRATWNAPASAISFWVAGEVV